MDASEQSKHTRVHVRLHEYVCNQVCRTICVYMEGCMWMYVRREIPVLNGTKLVQLNELRSVHAQQLRDSLHQWLFEHLRTVRESGTPAMPICMCNNAMHAAAQDRSMQAPIRVRWEPTKQETIPEACSCFRGVALLRDVCLFKIQTFKNVTENFLLAS
jgi:hypothetical protein